ncbi:pyridoxamine 5'-phosphate oxidase-domain-containing protein [Dunaliella salina]|uniref:Pyridoxamine 5'-phosphate oxidase-domain-containing protein n=1 Tax=Dunaliella salina TaxID=3046 RepID=A0ABQ7H6Z1_DUNSA|nr:pyridoxamine 5'-phosphate oxidase-domain-containing protein [Dunaliella salina]|eukprot:KAF5842623.1 pyridoxamine 5'-phosphate oxidase-domain-containing protein [Dunaliella salina]
MFWGAFFLQFLLASWTAHADTYTRPDHIQDAAMCRWLAHVVDYGTLATLKDGKPYGGIASYSDGAFDNPTGRLFFYFTPMGELPKNAAVDPQTSLTVTEAQLPDACPEPEEPTCAKVTFMGKFKKVENAEDQELARISMFKRHPMMASWSAISDHEFTLYELQIEEIHLLDYFGGAKQVRPADYFEVQLDTQTGDAPSPSAPQGTGNGNSITMGGIWVGAMAGSACGVSIVALCTLGYIMYIQRDKPYTLASCELK